MTVPEYGNGFPQTQPMSFAYPETSDDTTITHDGLASSYTSTVRTHVGIQGLSTVRRFENCSAR